MNSHRKMEAAELNHDFLYVYTKQDCRCVPYIFGNKAANGTYGSKYWFPGFGFDSGPNLQPCQRFERYKLNIKVVKYEDRCILLLFCCFCSRNLYSDGFQGP